MGQCVIADPAASRKLIFSIQPEDRLQTTLDSFRRCLKIVDTFRGMVDIISNMTRYGYLQVPAASNKH